MVRQYQPTMPYRHPRGSSGQDLSDDELEWPHLQPPSVASSLNVEQEGLVHVPGVGDVHGNPVTVGRRIRDSAVAAGDAPGLRAARVAARTQDAGFALEVQEAFAAMHSSSSSLSSSCSRSSSMPNLLSSSSSSSYRDGPLDGPDVSEAPDPFALQDPVSAHAEPLPFTGVEQLFSFLLLRGQTTVTQAAYRIVQCFFTDQLAAAFGMFKRSMRLPSLEAIRTAIAPRVRRALGLTLRPLLLPADGNDDGVTVGVIYPSDHVKRDFAFRETFDLFFIAGERSEEERKWHPEYCDSRMHSDRQAVLKGGAKLHAYVMDGTQLRAGNLVRVELSEGILLDQVIVGAGEFTGRTAGVQMDEAVHAADFTVPCSRDGVDIGLLNARHWLPGKHGRLTWHPVGHPVVEVMRVALEPAQPQPPPLPVVSDGMHAGRLTDGPDGQPLFKLGLAVFMDDFEVRSGRSSSAGGVYMLYLSRSFRHCPSRHAVRPIALAPPGVNSDDVLRAITDYLVDAATNGWMVKTRMGTTCG